MYKLYVFLRSDLESMSPGRAAAQVAHAASQCAAIWTGTPSYREWEGDMHFGTTVVLDGGSFEMLEFQYKNSILRKETSFKEDFYMEGVNFYMVRDTSYPLKDGKVTHLLDINTCYWHFGDPDLNNNLIQYLAKFKLYKGNHD